MENIIILQIAGFKNSGKTTLINHWVKTIKATGLSVVVIKHHGHGAKLDMPDETKDSMRYLASGADASIVSGAGVDVRLKSGQPLVRIYYNNSKNRSVSIMRVYDSEFKNYAVKLVLEEGKQRADVARELEVPYGTMTRWVTKHKKEEKMKAEEADYVTPSEHKRRIKELSDELADAKEENAILKKAARIFATKDQT